MNKEIEKNSLHRGEQLLDAIGEIKDEYVIEASREDISEAQNTFTVIEGSYAEDAADKRAKKRTWMKVMSAAAVLILCVGVVSIIKPTSKKETGDYPYEVETAEEPASSGALATAPGAEEKEAAEGDINFAEEAAEAEAEEISDGSIEGDIEPIDDPFDPYEPTQGEAFVLTAGQWNDNANWPFFTNLVNSGRIEFPSYGIDPRTRYKVTVVDEGGNPLANETVTLRTGGAGTLWTAKTNKEGVAYLFVPAWSGETPAYAECNGEMAMIESAVVDYDEPESENNPGTTPAPVPSDDITIVTSKAGENLSGVQVMFIVDTTGSMGDELAYLQMDFAKIAEDTAEDGVLYSANFYRDEGDDYVTKANGFTSDVNEVQRLISSEYAAGGGDTPEAVSDILYETITANGEWRSDMNKVCFLIFDAPPHYGTEDRIVEAVESAAARGIHVVPVVASNAERETELFGRALAICTDGEYVFLTDDSGVGDSHLEPIIGDYSVELLHDIIVRIINSYK